MALFNLDLDDARRDRLEAYRARKGLRSLAEAVRDLIDGAGGDGEVPARIPPVAPHGPRVDTTPAGRAAFLPPDDSETMELVREPDPDFGPGRAVHVGPVAPQPGSRLKKR